MPKDGPLDIIVSTAHNLVLKSIEDIFAPLVAIELCAQASIIPKIKLKTSPLTIPLLQDEISSKFLTTLTDYFYPKWGYSKAIFSPFLNDLWKYLKTASVTNKDYQVPLTMLLQLCEVTVGDSKVKDYFGLELKKDNDSSTAQAAKNGGQSSDAVGAKIKPFAELILDQVN